MRPRISFIAIIIRQAGWLAGLTATVCASVGCRNRAYTEVYVDNMAAEIRTLEDQLYQYDHEYRSLEQELLSLRDENDRLRQSGTQPQTRNKNSILQDNRSPGAYEFQPKQEFDLAPGEVFVPNSMQNPASDVNSHKPSTGSGHEPGSNSILDHGPTGPSDPTPDANKSLLPSPTLPLSNPTSRSSSGTLPTPGDVRPSSEIDSVQLNDLVPPSIQPGTPMPPSQPVLSPIGAPITGNSVAPNQLEINLGRIEIPGQLASVQNGPGQLKMLQEEVTDTRIVDLVFHGSLCRGHNFDDQPDDDGLYLVLQPKNERGQFVTAAADLSIVVLDPAREGDAARISLWNYSASEVQAKIQPIGSSQGIHLSLPWNGPDPIADRVVVFARYKMPDGRKLLTEKEIFVSGKDHIRTVWVPRVTNGAQPTTQLAQPSNRAPSQWSPSNVVRPASATMPAEPAPLPRNR